MVNATIKGKPVDLARNEIAMYALEQNHKFVYFFGDDTIPPYNILKQLIFRAEHNKDHGVITGVYCSKSEPAAPLVFRGNGLGSYWDWKVGEYFEITGCGMDAVLIRTDVFRELIPHVGRDKQGQGRMGSPMGKINAA
jgi:GT2 family glycosyltransferase